jgi:hypothetical protein
MAISKDLMVSEKGVADPSAARILILSTAEMESVYRNYKLLNRPSNKQSRQSFKKNLKYSRPIWKRKLKISIRIGKLEWDFSKTLLKLRKRKLSYTWTQSKR